MLRSLYTAVAVTAMVAMAGCGSIDTPVSAGSKEIDGSITVFAAASLTEAFTELRTHFEAAHPGVTVVYSFGASSTLAEQITRGAPADVFASASVTNMAQVVDNGDVSASPTIFVRNKLEIAVPKGNPGRIVGLADFGRTEPTIALCAQQVPCGAAAETIFRTAGIEPAPDTLEVDVKAVLAKVRLGEVDAALVYHTDVRAGGDEVDGIAVAEAARAVNDYPVATLTHAPNAAAADAFVAFAQSDIAREVFTKAGFDAP
ncbi:molybdate ABC transporter substrate-binding protein [Nocardia sp. CNY236]|uniref:molybdate ABC transporter substrate-binding protein n=1 Tax=Nocardia sp. CNY236 TaxID=1169152 RepID=UPI00048B56A4|nr:molybdate ABC transporter substrate-binding protein [Nocardia sp. CNY236]